jgi:hypothetical protein
MFADEKERNMKRIPAAVLSCLFALSGVAVAANCPPAETTCGKIPKTCASIDKCSMDAEWFAQYVGCKKEDRPVYVEQYFPLVLFTSNRQFKVNDFKKGSDSCDFSNATAVSDFAEPQSTAGQFAPVHVMTALKTGCYHVNLTFDDGCKVDPHIIVKQFQPTALHHKKRH